MDYSTEELIKMQEKQWEKNLKWFYMVFALIVSVIVLLACLTGKGEAATIVSVEQETLESCLNADNLPEGTKKAYSALKKEGYDVKVVCKEKQKPLTAEQLKAIEGLR